MDTNAIWWFKLVLLVVVTIGVTVLILWADAKIRKAKGANSNGHLGFRGVVFLILNLKDLF